MGMGLRSGTDAPEDVVEGLLLLSSEGIDMQLPVQVSQGCKGLPKRCEQNSWPGIWSILYVSELKSHRDVDGDITYQSCRCGMRRSWTDRHCTLPLTARRMHSGQESAWSSPGRKPMHWAWARARAGAWPSGCLEPRWTS